MKQFFAERLAQFTELRRELHRHPEVGFTEQYAAAKVRQTLDSLNIPYQDGIGKTGIVATIQGTQADNGRRIGLRADMDALPMTEKSTHDHCSTNPGCMHACGHDGHTTILIAVAHYLAQHRDFAGIIYLVFQPAEEGVGGARAMLEDGLLERFPMDEIYGLHNWPYMMAGKIAVRENAAMASCNRLHIRIKGVGGHGGAAPHLTIDPVRISATLINSLNTIIGREVDPSEPAVLSICAIQSGDIDAFNIIPDEAVLSGTVRTFAPHIQNTIEAAVSRICDGVAATYGATIELDYQRICPPTINTPACSHLVQESILETFAPGTLAQDEPASFASEDFADMLNACRGAYIFLGSGRHENDEPLHSPFFDFNDAVIPDGATLLTSVALKALQAVQK